MNAPGGIDEAFKLVRDQPLGARPAFKGAVGEFEAETEPDSEVTVSPPPPDRGWQLLDVSRASSFGGDPNYLPDSAAGWLTRWFDAAAITEPWAAREHLLRVEHLAAAAQAAGGKGHVHQEPVQATLRVPSRGGRRAEDHRHSHA